MKLRQSGMPEESYWETLFDVDAIIHRLGIGNDLRDVVELGCGYGTFSLPVAAAISGTLRSFDIEQAMVDRTLERARERGVNNLICETRDVFQDGFGVPSQSQDGCLLFNILHGERPAQILQEAARIINDHGLVFIIHWRFDPQTPRGPSLDIRPRPGDCLKWAEDEGLSLQGEIVGLPPYHYGLVLKKQPKHARAAEREVPPGRAARPEGA